MPSGQIHGHYNAGLVGLSVAIAIVAAFAALDQARRASQNTGLKRGAWLAGGGVTMALGIWSMHFVGMLAFEMPMPVQYQGGLVALSLIAAVVGASIALAVVTRPHVSRIGLVIGAAFMGVAVSSMHYLGMESMRMAATIHWNGWLVTLSVLIGFGASFVALWLVVHVSTATTGLRLGYHVLAAIGLGIGIAGLHYTAMQAATFYGTGSMGPGSSFSTSGLITLLGIVGGVVFIALLGVTVLDQRRADLALDLALVAGLARDLGRGSDVRGGVCEAARRLTGADHVVILETDDTQALRISASCGLEGDQARGSAASAEEHEILKNGQRRFIAGLGAGNETAAAGGGAAGSTLYEPLLLDGVPMALLAVRWNRRVRSLPERTKTLLSMLAADAAVVMDRHNLIHKLEHLARRDDLTGVANRRLLSEELDRGLALAARSLKPVSVIMLDLDNFKPYNDTKGHQAGDRLLMSVSAAWSALVRSTDTIARYGGDEFAVVLPDCPAERATQTAELLRTAVPSDVSCSAGVATWDFSESPEHLLDRADQALYQAKEAGRHQTRAAGAEL